MPPIHRWAHKPIRIPADLPDAARWVFHNHLDMPEAYGLEPDEEQALRRLRPLRRYASGFIRVKGGELATIRNLADTETLAIESECETIAEEAGYSLNDHECCGICEWCQALVLRDRIDYWLDQAGVHRNAYIEAGTADVETAWQHTYRGEPFKVLYGNPT